MKLALSSTSRPRESERQHPRSQVASPTPTCITVLCYILFLRIKSIHVAVGIFRGHLRDCPTVWAKSEKEKRLSTTKACIGIVTANNSSGVMEMFYILISRSLNYRVTCICPNSSNYTLKTYMCLCI